MTSSADDVLVTGPEAVLIRSDWTAELTRVPADQRLAFATSPQRIETMLNSLLVNRTLAQRARERGMEKDPIVQRRLMIEMERGLAAMMVERIETDAGAEFDRATEKNLARARELYLINRTKYVVPEEDDTIEEPGYVVELRRYRLPEIHLTNEEIVQFASDSFRPRAVYDNGRVFFAGARFKF